MEPLSHDAVNEAERQTPRPTLASHLLPGQVLPAQGYRMGAFSFDLLDAAVVVRVETIHRVWLEPAPGTEVPVPAHVDVPMGGRPLAEGLPFRHRPRPLLVEPAGLEDDPADGRLQETWDRADNRARGAHGG
jgi:hypothetical protein